MLFKDSYQEGMCFNACLDFSLLRKIKSCKQAFYLTVVWGLGKKKKKVSHFDKFFRFIIKKCKGIHLHCILKQSCTSSKMSFKDTE